MAREGSKITRLLDNSRNMHKRFRGMSSSVNPEELSLTVQSGIRFFLGLVVSLGYLTTVQADSIITQVPLMVVAGYTAWQALETIWGGIRKILVKFAEQ